MKSQTAGLSLWARAGIGVGLLATGAAFYLGGTRAELGFPLDDAWIHQTLARNLVLYGQLAVNPGQPAAASTSPLWTVLLAVGVPLGLAPYAWAYLLGAASLLLTAWQTVLLGKALLPERSRLSWVAAGLVLVEWRLVWAAFSGMETLLFTALTVAALRASIAHGSSHPWQRGMLAGLVALTRFEGFVLGGLLLGWHFLQNRKGRPTGALWYGLAFGALVAVGLLFNLWLGGSLLPSTLLAKHESYSAGLDLSAAVGFLGGALLVFARGPLLLLLPGLAFGLVRRFPSLNNGWQPLALWAALLLGGYALWLPVLYHHGRYLFPLIPLVTLLGLVGTQELLRSLPFRLLPNAVALLLLLTAVVGWLRGGQAYADDVAFINGEQVAIARWLQQHAPPDALVAAHDVGALGYFSERRLVDLGGLATPWWIVSPRDVATAQRVVQEQSVRYLEIIPDWYPPLYQALVGLPGVQEVPLPLSGPTRAIAGERERPRLYEISR